MKTAVLTAREIGLELITTMAEYPSGPSEPYLKYRKAADYGDERESPWEEQTEIAEEFLGDFPYDEN